MDDTASCFSGTAHPHPPSASSLEVEEAFSRRKRKLCDAQNRGFLIGSQNTPNKSVSDVMRHGLKPAELQPLVGQ